MVAGLASACAPEYYSLLFLRTIVGLGVGGSIVPFDLMAEVFPKSQRGAMMSVSHCAEIILVSEPIVFVSMSSIRNWYQT